MLFLSYYYVKLPHAGLLSGAWYHKDLVPQALNQTLAGCAAGASSVLQKNLLFSSNDVASSEELFPCNMRTNC